MNGYFGGTAVRSQHSRAQARRIVTMLTMLFFVFSHFGPLTVAPAIAQEGTPVVEADPVAEQTAAQEPVVTEPVTEPVAAEQPAVEAPAAEAPAQEPAAEPVVEQPAPEEAAVEEPVVNETSGVFTDVAAEPVVVEEAPVSCVQAEGVSPWIASDLADYPPGALVTLSGGSWVPGQTVELFVDDDGVADAEMGEWSLFDVMVADDGGNIFYQFNLPNWFVADYFATATGECSQATTSFTDGNVSFRVASGVPQVNATATVYQNTASCSGNVTATYTGAMTSSGLTLTAGANQNQRVSLTAPQVGGHTFMSWTLPDSTTTSTPSLCVPGFSGGGTTTYIANYQVSQAATTLTVSPATGTYGGTVTLSATLTGSGTTGISGKTIDFTLNGTSAGSATTDASGVATLASVSIAGINVGSAEIGAGFAGDTAHKASTGSGTLTILPTTVTITLGNLEQAYTGNALAVSVETSPVDVSGDVAVVYTDANGNEVEPINAGIYTATATLTNANHTAAETSETLTISQATATLALGNLNHTYDGAAKAATARTTPADLNVTITYDGSTTAPTNAGEYTVVATIDDANYEGSATDTLTIGKAAASVTPNAAGKTYGETDPTLGGTLEGFLEADNVTATYSRTTGDAAGTYTISAELTADGDLGNYDVTYNTAEFTIGKADQTIDFESIASSMKFGDAPFTVSATADSGLPVSFAVKGACSISGTTVTITGAGSCTVTASQAGNTNYNETQEVQVVSIAMAQLRVDGFYQPIDMGKTNSTKGGSTVPFKFEVFDGGVELTDTSKFRVIVAKAAGCGGDAGAVVPLEETATGSTSLRYDTQSGQFIYNLKTDKAAGICYTVSVVPVDANNVELAQARTAKILTK